MILGFKRQFVEKILNGEKIHTIREDKYNRWKAGNKIHFATGIRTKDYNQFADGKCISVQKIRIGFLSSGINCVWTNKEDSDMHIVKNCAIKIDDRLLNDGEILELIKSDGLTPEGFINWFYPSFEGKLIHWTDKKY